MNILFVHEVSYLSKVVFEMHDFPELLAERGHNVTFIDFPEGRRPTGRRRILDLRTTVTPNVNRSHQGGTIEIRTPGRVLPPPLDRVAGGLTQYHEIARTIREKRIDVVVLYGVPTNGWQTIRAARRLGVPVVFRAIDVSHLLRKTRLAPLIHLAERYVYRSANWLSTHNGALLEYCIAEGADATRSSLEYPGVDLVRFAPSRHRAETRRSLGFARDDRVAVFMGTLYRFAGLEWFISLLAPHLRQDRGRKLLIIGDGEERGALTRLVGEAGLQESIRMVGVVAYDALPAMLGAADIAVNPFAESLVTDCALPGKILQYMASGLPTVTTPLKGLRSVVGEDNGVVFSPPGETFTTAAVGLLDVPDHATYLGALARVTITKSFSWADCLDRFEARLASVVALHSSRVGTVFRDASV